MAATPITRRRLRRLADCRPERGRVLSVFLNLDPREFPTPAARASEITSVLTAAAHQIDEAEGLDHDERVALREDVERVREVLRGNDLAANGTHGLAVYACAPADLLEVLKLDYPVEPKVKLERAPYVEPLVAAGEDEVWSVLLVNRRSARIFSGGPRRLEETDQIEDDVHRQHDQGGWSQARYQRSVEKEKDDHVAHALAVLFTNFKRRPFDHLLVGAPGELVGEVEQRLHPYLRERLAGRIGVDVEHSSVEEVREAASRAIEAFDRRREREALDRLAQGVGSGARGVGGRKAVKEALEQARVAVLLIDDGLVDGEEAIEKALEQSASVIVVRHHDDLGPLGGIGAILRY